MKLKTIVREYEDALCAFHSHLCRVTLTDGAAGTITYIEGDSIHVRLYNGERRKVRPPPTLFR